jgi:catechol-2,3-dioxygenase
MKIFIRVLSMVLILFVILAGAEGDFSSKIISMGVVVSDLEKSMAFYKDVVGMVQVDQKSFEVNTDVGWRTGLTDSIPFHVEVLKLGSGENTSQFKLMTFGDKARKQKNNFIHDQTGMQYITILVTELEPFIKRIKEHKVKMLGETPTLLNENTYFILIKDPDGTFVELIGPMKKKD